MNKNLVETVMGAVVLIVAAGFLLFAYKSSRIQSVSGYSLTARFDRADGLATGSDVRISGIKIGTVSEQKIDTKTYQAIVVLSIDDSIKIPTDSAAEIVGDGLLGSKYLAVVPGAEDNMLADGGEIRFTQSSVSLESLIGKFMFSNNNDKKGGSNAPAGEPAPQKDIAPVPPQAPSAPAAPVPQGKAPGIPSLN